MYAPVCSGPSSTASTGQQQHRVYLTLYADGDESLAAYCKPCEQVRALLATRTARMVWRLEPETTSESGDKAKQPPALAPPVLLPR